MAEAETSNTFGAPESEVSLCPVLVEDVRPDLRRKVTTLQSAQ